MKPQPKPFDLKAATGSLASKLAEAVPGEKIIDLPVTKVIPNPRQHRKHFDPDRLRELADSIAATGQELPIVVRPNPTAGEAPYIIVSGERRWRACGLAQLPTVKAVVRQINPEDENKILLSEAAENWQREALTIAESITLATDLVGRFGLQEAAKQTGKPKTLLSKMTTIGKAPAVVAECVKARMVEDVETLHRLASLAKESEADAVRLVEGWKLDATKLVGVRGQIDAARQRVEDRKNPTPPPKPPAQGSAPKAVEGHAAEPESNPVSSATHIEVGGSVEPATSAVPPVSSVPADTVRPAAGSQRSESAEAPKKPASPSAESSGDAPAILVAVSARFEATIVVLETKSGPVHFDRAALVSVLGLDD